MQNGLEELDELLDDGLHHDPVVVLQVFSQQDGRATVSSKGLDETALHELPSLEGQNESSGLEEQHERHPLVVRRVGSVVGGFDSFLKIDLMLLLLKVLMLTII